LQNLLNERKDRYSQADVRIQVTEDMDQKTVADTVIRELHDFIDNNPPQWKLAKAKAKGESCTLTTQGNS
jgi:shikimate kinase